MTFGLTGWLKSRHKELDYEIPVWFPSREKRDNREWLVVNGLGGYAMGTVCGAGRRRYHCALAAALTPPVARSIVLSRVEEQISIDGVDYELATNAWASGVVSPTGYKHLECFSTLPTPTWVYELGGHYLIKRLVMPHGKNEVYFGYTFIPDPDRPHAEAKLTARFLIGYRDFHGEVKGSSDDRYPQFVSPNQTMIILNESGARLCLSWQEGEYEAQKQWWWDYKWAEEAARGEPDSEDLFFVGCVSAALEKDSEYSLGASFENAMVTPDVQLAVDEVIERQRFLIRRASLPRAAKTDMLILACDQFLVPAFEQSTAAVGKRSGELTVEASTASLPTRMSVIEGYPWFNDAGRAALTALPGLTLATRRFAEAASVLRTFSERLQGGLIANRTLDPALPVTALSKPGLEYRSLDTSLWFAWSIYQYYRITRDRELVIELMPALLEIYRALRDATIYGIKTDADGLLATAPGDANEFSWMDARVADIPITPRHGKAVELNALWYNFLESTLFLAGEVEKESAAQTALLDSDLLTEMRELGKKVRQSMQKFWDGERNCLYDLIEVPPGPGERGPKNDESIRPNQLLAVSLPFRTLEREQEKSILHCVESELLTPMAVRTLSLEDGQYQSSYGCGFEHADQYHRDLSYHQGTAWTWLLGVYIEALINVYGPLPETITRVRLLLGPLLEHLTEEALLGSISEIFDGGRPHLPRGCPAHAQAVGECMRWHNWLLKQ